MAAGGDWAIRPATDEDAAAVRETALAAGLDEWGSFLGRERIENANRDRVYPANLVAEDDGGVFAFVAWDADTGEVSALFVHPRGQRRGAGSALLGAAEDALRGAGHAQAHLFTEERSSGVRDFYARCGWTEVDPPRVRDWHGARLVEPRCVKPLEL